MIRSPLFAVAAAAGLAFGAAAVSAPASAQVVTKDPGHVQSGNYTVEPAHTRVLFAVSHMGFTTWYGDVSGASGTLDFNAKAPTHSKLSITLPTGSISTTNPKLDGELKSPTWLDAAKYPTITFNATSITRTGHDTGRIKGELTLHGVTQPVTLDAHFNGGGINPLDKAYTIGFDGTTTIQRSAFGIKTYVPLIGDTVTVTISSAFERRA
jgi:polyisoprenoid-binding protein YceI